MKAAALQEYRLSLDEACHQLPSVAGYLGQREPGYLGVGKLDGPFNHGRETPQSGAQDDGGTGSEIPQPLGHASKCRRNFTHLIRPSSSRTDWTMRDFSASGRKALSNVFTIRRSISGRVKPSWVWASQYSW